MALAWDIRAARGKEPPSWRRSILISQRIVGWRLHWLNRWPITAIAGHISPKRCLPVTQTYVWKPSATHWELSPASGQIRGKNEGYDTNNDTNPLKEPVADLHVIEINGGDDETRTRDLCRDRAAF